MTDDLVAFLRARLDEDERTARAVQWDGSGNQLAWELSASATVDVGRDEFYAGDRTIAQHIARHDPARVLRDVEAKRLRVNAHSRPHECIELSGSGERSVVDGEPWELWESQHTEDDGPCFVLRTDALPYADHPDYREEWRP